MNTTFKKTLVASAILAFAGAAQAVQTPQTAAEYSKQGVTQAATVTPAAPVITLEAEYAVGDIIDITFPGAVFDATNAPAFVLSAAGMEVGVLSVGTNSIRLRVTQQATASTISSTLTINGLVFTSASIAASGAVGISYAAQTSTGLALDAGAASKPTGKLIALVDQFTTEVTPFDAVIDVNADRLLFTGALPADKRADALVITPANDAALSTLATLTTITYKVVGDFSFLDQDASGTVSAGELAAAAITGGDAITGKTLSADMTTLTFVDTPVAPATPAAVTLTSTISAADPAVSKVVIKPSDYTVTATFAHTTPAGSVAIEKSAGSWKLNGSQVRVPYMVVGGSRFGIIANVTNHSAKDGAITLDIFAEDGTKIASNYPAGTAKAGSVTSVAPALLAALGGSPATVTKFSFQVTTNVPENDVLVYAAYTDNTTSERAIVNNDSKVQTK
ncbi:hypothetical protein [Rheinheimera aquimaris]|uniref:hypothetical protein n=1 Tax=Rheinheimera aquimaris TaxID=412437 RepID=UPI003A969B3C